jgi:glycosyltransferase involved in cell wall biosynthesis
MKILHITSHLEYGGIPRVVQTLAVGFKRRGHAVVVASAGGPMAAVLEQDGIGLWAADLNTSAGFGWRVWCASQGLLKRLQRERIDIVHAHTRVAQIAAARIHNSAGIPYVCTWHGFYRRNLGRRLWPCTGQRTVAISQPIYDDLIQRWHVPPQDVHLIPHGIEVQAFRPASEEEKRAASVALGLNPAQPIIGTVSRLAASKGVDQLIEALPAVVQAVPQVQVLIVGEGEARAPLQQRVQALGLQRLVSFMPNQPARAVYPVFDLFIFLPAVQEGFGMTLLEAAACGLPVVAVERGGGAEWLIHDLGVVSTVAPQQPQALAEAIIHGLQYPERTAEQARGLRAAVEQRYALDVMLQRTEALYRGLLP